MNKTFAINKEKSDTVSRQMGRLARLLQLKSPDAVIAQEIAALQRELTDATLVISVSCIVEARK